MTLPEAARLMRSLGARDALNLDGGGSTTMTVRGEVVNRPSDRGGERRRQRRPVRDAMRAAARSRPRLAIAVLVACSASARRPRIPAPSATRRRLGRRRRRHAGPGAPTGSPRSSAARSRTASSTWATSTRPAPRREFRRWYHPRFGSLAGITLPTHGNHEWGNRFKGYYRYWAGRKGRNQPPWSKRTIAGWQILDLNSQAPHGAGSPQVDWLEHARRRRATAASPSGTAPATARAPTAARRTSTRSGTGSPATRGSCSAATTTISSATARSTASRSTWSAPAGAAATCCTAAPTMVWGRDDVNGAAAHRPQAGPRAARVPRPAERARLLDRTPADPARPHSVPRRGRARRRSSAAAAARGCASTPRRSPSRSWRSAAGRSSGTSSGSTLTRASTASCLPRPQGRADRGVRPDQRPPGGPHDRLRRHGEETPTGGRIARVRDRLEDGRFCATYADGVADIDLHALRRLPRAARRRSPP